MRLFNAFIVMMGFICASPDSPAQVAHGSVTGQALAGNGPAMFVNVRVEGLNMGAVTDETGRYTIARIPLGAHVLTFSAIGIVSKQVRITIVPGETVVGDVVLEESIAQLDEVVVTGTMKEVTRMKSPIPIEVYAPSFFQKNPTPNIFEAMSNINGVQPQINCNVCNTGDIHINGLEGPYTMILIDGMPIVSSLSTVYGLSGIPNSMVKRMEIVKGPASTLYGSEALGGVINIITKDPATSPRFRSDIFTTSVGELNADVSTRLGTSKARGLLGINAYGYRQRRDINHDNFTDVPLQQRVSLFNKWTFQRNAAGSSSSLAARYYHENRWGGEMQWTPAYRGSDVYYGESIITNRFELLGNIPLAQQQLNLDYSYNHHHQDSYYGLVPFMATQHVAFAQVRWNIVHGRHDLLAGLPMRYIYYDDNTVGTSATNNTNQPSVTFLPGIFLQDEITLNPHLTTLAGMRYDHNNIHGSIWTPRLSFKYAINPDNVIRLTSGSGYRVVNLFTEDHAALTGARQVVIKNDLRPEQSWNINLNYARSAYAQNSFFNFDVSLFYTYFSNKIVGDFYSDPNLIIYDNLGGHAISQGATVNIDASLSNGLKVIAGVTYLDVFSVNETQVKVPQIHAPKISATLSTSMVIAPLRTTLDLTGRLTGPMYLPTVPNDYRPSQSPWFAILNLQCTRQVSDHIEVYGGVKNLLNYIPKDPLLRPFDPFDKQVDQNNPMGYTFDTSYNYAQVQGLKGYLGVRWVLN